MSKSLSVTVLAAVLFISAGCGGGSGVEIPDNPDAKPPGRPSAAAMGDGDDDNAIETPPAAALPE